MTQKALLRFTILPCSFIWNSFSWEQLFWILSSLWSRLHSLSKMYPKNITKPCALQFFLRKFFFSRDMFQWKDLCFSYKYTGLSRKSFAIRKSLDKNFTLWQLNLLVWRMTVHLIPFVYQWQNYICPQVSNYHTQNLLPWNETFF